MMNILRSTRIPMLTPVVQHSFWHKSKQKRSVISFLSNWHSLQKRSLGTNFSLNLDELIEVERRKMSFEESSMVSGTRRTDERHESKVFLTEYYTSCILQNWCCHWFCVKLSISGFRSLVLFLPQFLWLVQSDHTACKRIDKEWFLWKYQLLSRDRQTIDFFSLLKQYKEEMTKEKRFLSQVSRCEEKKWLNENGHVYFGSIRLWSVVPLPSSSFLTCLITRFTSMIPSCVWCVNTNIQILQVFLLLLCQVLMLVLMLVLQVLFLDKDSRLRFFVT